MRLKSVIDGFNTINDAQLSRPLLESIIAPGVITVVEDLIVADIPGIIIGDLALSFYGKPRYTDVVEVLFASDTDVPDTIPGFERIGGHEFQHISTQVKVLTPQADIPDGLVNQVINTALTSSGIRVASRSGLVALKLLYGGLQDKADIDQLIKTGDIDLLPFSDWLTDDHMDMYTGIRDNISKKIIRTYGDIVFDPDTKIWGLWCSAQGGFYISYTRIDLMYKDIHKIMLSESGRIEKGE